MSKASEVSAQVRQKHGITSTMTTLYNVTSAAAIQFFIIMGDRAKSEMRTYLSIMDAQLETEKTKLYSTLDRSDVVAKSVHSTINLLLDLCRPMEDFLAQFPIDTLILAAIEKNEMTEPPTEVKRAASDVLSGIAGSNPITIPQNIIQGLRTLGIDCTSLFSGVTSFKDLKDKIKILEFQLARATSKSVAAQKGIEYCEEKLKEYQVYKDILDLIT